MYPINVCATKHRALIGSYEKLERIKRSSSHVSLLGDTYFASRSPSTEQVQLRAVGSPVMMNVLLDQSISFRALRYFPLPDSPLKRKSPSISGDGKSTRFQDISCYSIPLNHQRSRVGEKDYEHTVRWDSCWSYPFILRSSWNSSANFVFHERDSVWIKINTFICQNSGPAGDTNKIHSIPLIGEMSFASVIIIEPIMSLKMKKVYV